jgi:GT2 family glycosyltransferase
MFEVSCSIVLYKNNPAIIKMAVDSLYIQDVSVQLFIFDNSPDDSLKDIFDEKVIYIHRPENVGFGKGHNYCIEKGLVNSKYHLILNPDVYFEPGVLRKMMNEYEANPQLGLIAPKVLYPDERVQYSCRMLPTPFELLIRRLPFISFFLKKWIDERNLAFTGYNKKFSPPFVLGCFMFIPKSVFEKVGMFDENMFMYMEDFDLTRRIKKHYKTLFLPEAVICHAYERQSAKQLKLLYFHLKSSFYYFGKWGWFFDAERIEMNSIKNITLPGNN